MVDFSNVMPDDVENVKVTQTDIERMINKVLADKIAANKSTKLTWTEGGRTTRFKDKILGPDGFNGRLEHIMIGRGAYWIQNGRIFNGAKRRINIDDVDSFYRPWVDEAFGNFKKQAIASDDALCPRCLDAGEPFVAKSYEEYANHVISKHTPTAVEAIAKTATPAITNVPDAPKPVEFQALTKVFTTNSKPQERGNFICGDCSKNLSTERGLKIHTARLHGKK